MLSYWKNSSSALSFAAALALAFGPFALAQEELDEETMSSDEGEIAEEQEHEEELVVIGSQGERARSVHDSPVPVDVLNTQDLSAGGNHVDLSDTLRMLLPAFNATVGSETAAFVRPVSLRGLGADELLVMLNGKRRHRSPVIHDKVAAGGRGAHGVNLAMIPSASLEAIELLRDGAGAQYGSDAIAGVLNLRMKAERSGGEVRAQRGYAYAGEPTYRVDGWAGYPLGREGFLTFSGEWLENFAHSRGIERPETSYLRNAGITTVAIDSPFNDGLVETWGRPENQGTKLFFNMAFGIGGAEAYSHGSWGAIDSRHRLRYRSPPVEEVGQPGHDTIWELASSCWEGRFWLQIFYPSWEVNSVEDCIWATSHEMGFTPFLDAFTRSVGFTTGIRGEADNGFRWDISVTDGHEKMTYWNFNSRNGSQGVDTFWAARPYQFEFYLGRVRQMERLVNIDFDYPVDDSTFVSFGFQAQEEGFTQVEGEDASYAGSGASGFSGFGPETTGNWERDSMSVYAELERQFGDTLFLQAAIRGEDFEELKLLESDSLEGFDDFHGRWDYKLAGRMQINRDFAARGSVSTGFHAPTVAQTYFSHLVALPVFNFPSQTIPEPDPRFEGTISPYSELALAEGSNLLNVESSTNLSFGVTGQVVDEWEITADFYQVDINDRIYYAKVYPPAVDSLRLESEVQFLQNALNLSSSGIDIVVSGTTDLFVNRETDLNVAYNFNQISVDEQIPLSNGNMPLTEAQIEDIENSTPSSKLVATAMTALNDRYDLMVRFNWYGPHHDENGRIGGVDDNPESKELSSTMFVDMEVAGEFMDKWRLAFGVSNLFDQYPDEIEEPFANMLNLGMPYPLRSVTNFEGGSWYLSGVRKW